MASPTDQVELSNVSRPRRWKWSSLSGIALGFSWIAVLLPGFGGDVQSFLRATHALLEVWYVIVDTVFDALQYIMPFDVSWNSSNRDFVTLFSVAVVPLSVPFGRYFAAQLMPRVEGKMTYTESTGQPWLSAPILDFPITRTALVVSFLFVITAQYGGRGPAMQFALTDPMPLTGLLTFGCLFLANLAILRITAPSTFLVLSFFGGALLVWEVAFHMPVFDDWVRNVTIVLEGLQRVKAP